MFNPFSLEGKLILISGASSGIGRQCAIDCSRMGAKIVLLARDTDRLNDTYHLLEGKGHSIYSYNLLEIDGIKQLVSVIVSEQGKLDGFIHAAGIERTLPLKNLKASDYEEVYRINALSAFEFIHQFSSKKNFNNNGHIVLIASITAVIGRIGVSAYSASKGALVSAIRSMALEFAKREITINCISPGTILTPMMERFLGELTPEQYDNRVKGFPLGLGSCNDISNACIYLLSDASRWITGQNLIIDGGYTSH